MEINVLRPATEHSYLQHHHRWCSSHHHRRRRHSCTTLLHWIIVPILILPIISTSTLAFAEEIIYRVDPLGNHLYLLIVPCFHTFFFVPLPFYTSISLSLLSLIILIFVCSELVINAFCVAIVSLVIMCIKHYNTQITAQLPSIV